MRIEISEEQRQIVLLALHELRVGRPGWNYAIGEIEKTLGGQLNWPDREKRGVMISTGPQSKEEYMIRFHANQKLTGYGIAGVTQHMPCPFCAAPDWMVFKVVEVEDVMKRDTKCGECGRSAKALFERSAGGVSFEMVQTGGEDQPDWFEPKMRRIEASELT